MRRATSAVLLSVLLMGMLTLQLGVEVVSADIYYFNLDIAVEPEFPSTHDNVGVTVSFETPYIYFYPANFSEVSQSENNFSIIIEIYPADTLPPVTDYEEETYNLGTLPVALYQFSVDVQVWSAPPDEPFRMLLESESYSQSFTVAALTITVPNDYLTIQEAINAANEGDTVFVRNGTYYEHVIVNKSITLRGQSRLNTILDGNTEPEVVTVTANNVNIHGFTIQNADGGFSNGGIRLVSSNNNVSYNTIVNNFMHGIVIAASSNNTVAHNDILMNIAMGIWIDECANNSIYENNIFSNLDSGIFGSTSSGNRIVGNSVFLNKFMGIYLMRCTGDEVTSNTVSSNFHGIYLSTTDHILVDSNNVSSANNFGIFLRDSLRCTVSRNIASNSTYGIQLFGESNVNVVSNNLFAYNDYGMSLSPFPVPSVVNNTFYGNTVKKNNLGISVESVGSNLLFHNNFIENIQNAEINNPQVWDNGCEGNYWSTYNGSDLNNDGIGDTYLPWEGVDHYPVMNLYWNPGDIDHDLDVDIFDVVKCAIAYGSTPLDVNWNPHCDIAEPYGIINIFDLVTIAASYGEEYTP